MANFTVKNEVILRNSGFIVSEGEHELTVLVAGGEWSALYVDNDLAAYGDHYIVKEAIYSILGVEEEYRDSWYREVVTEVPAVGRHKAHKKYSTQVAQTLAEADSWKVERDTAAEKIEALRAEADRLTRQYKL